MGRSSSLEGPLWSAWNGGRLCSAYERSGTLHHGIVARSTPSSLGGGMWAKHSISFNRALPFDEHLRDDDGAQLGASTSLVLVPLVVTSASGTCDCVRQAHPCFFLPLFGFDFGEGGF